MGSRSQKGMIGLFGLVLGLIVATSCSRFQADDPVVVFNLDGAHATLDCESCHGPPPFEALPVDCLSCHELDRKNENHYPGQTCNGTAGVGCHSASDLLWSDVGVAHDFLPLEGSHGGPCEDCHATPEGGNDLEGQAAFCWNCHEEDRPDGHYAQPGDPLDPLYRWDCGPCHEAVLFTSSFIFHQERTPHAAVDYDAKTQTCAPTPDFLWVTGCEGCHPDNTEAFTCLGCHAGVHAYDYREDDAACTTCHPNAQMEECDSLNAPPDTGGDTG